MDKAKIVAVQDFLRSHFPGHPVKHWHDFSTDIHKFKVDLPEGPPLLLGITDEILDEVAATGVRDFLDARGVGLHLEKCAATSRGLLVTSDGFRALADE